MILTYTDDDYGSSLRIWAIFAASSSRIFNSAWSMAKAKAFLETFLISPEMSTELKLPILPDGAIGARPFGHPIHSTPSQLMEKFENCDCMLRYSIRLYFEIRCKVQYLTWCSDPRQAGECFYTSKYWGSSHAPGLVLENLAKLTKPSIGGFTSSSMNKQLCSQGRTEFVFQI